jgi:hypothetical protein
MLRRFTHGGHLHRSLGACGSSLLTKYKKDLPDQKRHQSLLVFLSDFFVLLFFKMSSRVFNCSNDRNSFCYVCANYIFKNQRKFEIQDNIKVLYQNLFDLVLADHEQAWAPGVVCASCISMLKRYESTKNKPSMTIPAVWREPLFHPDSCYMCQFNPKGLNKNNISKYKYPQLESCIRPVHSQNQVDPQSSPPEDVQMSSSSDDYQKDEVTFVTDEILNDLAKNLNLSKNKSLLLGRSLKSLKLLVPNCTFFRMRNRDKDFLPFFKTHGRSSYCHDIE